MEEWLNKYADAFDDGFPMYQIGRTRTEDEVIDIIKECLSKKKDAYELGYCTDDLGVLY